MPDFEELAEGLRRRAASRNDREQAAVELLIWHETFLRRRDFFEAAVGIRGDAYHVSWDRARRFAEHAPRVSSSQRTVLELAAWIATDPLGLSRLGHIHAYKAAEALAAALGQSLEGLIPEPGHNHPDFIPGTPEDCGACAREAKDEGEAADVTDNGPYETSNQVRHLPAVRAIYDVMHDAPGRGAGRDECEQLLTAACEKAGVTLGAYDARIIRWLANWEPETCAVIAGLIARAAQRPEGTVTEWGVRFTLGGSVEESAVPDEAGARRAVESMRRNHPDFEPIVMVQREAARPAGPWTPVPGEGEGSG